MVGWVRKSPFHQGPAKSIQCCQNTEAHSQMEEMCCWAKARDYIITFYRLFQLIYHSCLEIKLVRILTEHLLPTWEEWPNPYKMCSILKSDTCILNSLVFHHHHVHAKLRKHSWFSVDFGPWCSGSNLLMIFLQAIVTDCPASFLSVQLCLFRCWSFCNHNVINASLLFSLYEQNDYRF